jgi:hypothetical protein
MSAVVKAKLECQNLAKLGRSSLGHVGDGVGAEVSAKNQSRC